MGSWLNLDTNQLALGNGVCDRCLNAIHGCMRLGKVQEWFGSQATCHIADTRCSERMDGCDWLLDSHSPEIRRGWQWGGEGVHKGSQVPYLWPDSNPRALRREGGNMCHRVNAACLPLPTGNNSGQHQHQQSNQKRCICAPKSEWVLTCHENASAQHAGRGHDESPITIRTTTRGRTALQCGALLC